MGDFSEAFNFMIASLDNNEKALKKKIKELEKALSHIDTLEGILPICANCKKIRIEGSDPKDQKNWIEIEDYIGKRTEARFSHSICPECRKKLYPKLSD
jgi:lysyl-tRNA synthetase class I